MIRILVFLVVAVFSTLCQAECEPAADVARDFMNAYKMHVDDALHRKFRETTEHWLQRNSGVTASFKVAYIKVIEDARKVDPEMGLGFDPIFDAQDYPDQGFKIASCDEKSGLVTLMGVDWEDFRVVVKVVRVENRWFVDGAGIVNIHGKLRARRN